MRATLRSIPSLALGALALSSTLLASAAPLRADTLVLVQGYLGSAGSWRASGIVPVLHQRGWSDAGHLLATPDGRVHEPVGVPSAANRLYTIDLPTEAPVPVQAAVLAQNLLHVAARHPDEKLIVAAHSAGGVVARFAAVVDRRVRIDTLVTIASPHLGTATAEVGSMIGNSPLSWIAPFFGADTVNRSQVLYRDLWRERPDTLLGWLNRQPHPSARYVSVIRATDLRGPLAGDSVVSGWSQDMNAAPALAGRSERVISPGDHGLRTDDALLIADLLAVK